MKPKDRMTKYKDWLKRLKVGEEDIKDWVHWKMQVSGKSPKWYSFKSFFLKNT